MARYLGVDGGGSKTALALVDDTGHNHRPRNGSDVLLLQRRFDIVEKSLAQGVTDICTQAGITTADIDAAFFGLPGTARRAATSKPRRVPAGELGHDRYSCDNDMVCGWAGSLAARTGST